MLRTYSYTLGEKKKIGWDSRDILRVHINVAVKLLHINVRLAVKELTHMVTGVLNYKITVGKKSSYICCCELCCG